MSLVLAAAFLPLLSGCGDESSSIIPRTLDLREVQQETASLDDLPECEPERTGELAKVKDLYYTCFGMAWEPVDDFVAGVCNIYACGDDAEGEMVYVESGKVAYRCGSGKWKDASGEMFTDSAFIDCYVAAIVTAKVDVLDSLKNCSERREGDLAYVADEIYACASRKWIKQQGTVVSEDNLGECGSDKNMYVLSKMASYTCKDGRWFRVGAPQTPDVKSSSSSEPPSSSSEVVAEPPSSSSEVVEKPVSSSSETVVEVVTTTDTTKVRGVCIASRSNASIGDSVSYVFYNMGGTPVSYSWYFGEKGTPVGGSDVSPVVTYSGGGNHRAMLVLNEGLPSQSDVITCTGVKIPGIPITGCKCGVSKVSTLVSPAYPDSVVWTVSGCQGGNRIVYDWDLPSGEAASRGNTLTAVISIPGNYAPTVTAINDDDEMQDVACPAVSAAEKKDISASCEIDFKDRFGTGDNGFTVVVRDFRNADYVTELPLTLTSDYGYSFDGTAVCASSGETYYDGKYVSTCYYWGYNENSYEIPQPDVPGRHIYSISTGGDEVCEVTSPVSCAPVSGSVARYDTARWSVRGIGDYREGSYQWKFIDSDSNITYSTEPVPRVTFPEKGRVYASLVLDEGEATEANLNCSSISVVGRPILDCECLVELVSDTNNLSLVDEVQYKWTVAGCTTTAPPLLYYWPNGYEQSGIDSASVVRSFTKVGTYSPTVNVVNGDSTVARMACESASVINKAPANPIAPADSTDNLLDDITE